MIWKLNGGIYSRPSYETECSTTDLMELDNIITKPRQNSRWQYDTNLVMMGQKYWNSLLMTGVKWMLSNEQKFILVQLMIEENSFWGCKMKGRVTVPIFIISSLIQSWIWAACLLELEDCVGNGNGNSEKYISTLEDFPAS